MNIFTSAGPLTRRTSADEIFDRLRSDIVNLQLIPGTKLSEAEVAKQNDVSRQPVREAFIRLNDMNLLQIRPQKATVVRKISVQDILNTRFIRMSVEIEVVRRACADPRKETLSELEANLRSQSEAVEARDGDRFHALDYDFHRLICRAADLEFAFQTISDNKAQVDRLCMLSLADDQEMKLLLNDHREIVGAIQAQDEDRAISFTRLHLGRLDRVLTEARNSHAHFFED